MASAVVCGSNSSQGVAVFSGKKARLMRELTVTMVSRVFINKERKKCNSTTSQYKYKMQIQIIILYYLIYILKQCIYLKSNLSMELRYFNILTKTLTTMVVNSE